MRQSNSHRLVRENSSMTFSVKSNSFKDGDYLGQAHILSADFGFGCAGGNQSPHLAWSGARLERRASPSPATIRTRRRAADFGIGWW